MNTPQVTLFSILELGENDTYIRERYERSCYSPLHWLEVVQKWTETATAFKQHGAKAPVVHGNSVRLILKKLRCLRGRYRTFLIFYSQHSE